MTTFKTFAMELATYQVVSSIRDRKLTIDDWQPNLASILLNDLWLDSFITQYSTLYIPTDTQYLPANEYLSRTISLYIARHIFGHEDKTIMGTAKDQLFFQIGLIVHSWIMKKYPDSPMGA